MRRAAMTSLLAAALAAGCGQPTMTQFEYGKIRLEVGGRIVRAGEALAIRGLEPGVYYSIDTQARQVLIDVRLKSLDLTDQSILGVKWWPGKGEPVQAAHVENTTPQRTPVRLSFGIGGDRTDARHGTEADSAKGRLPGFESTERLRIGFPASIGGGRAVTSVRMTFDLPDGAGVEQSYLLVPIQTGLTKDRQIIAQPLILPMTTGPKPKGGAPAESNDAPTHVVVRDGQRLVIGGHVRSEEQVRLKVPILGDLPTLSRLFRATNGEVRQLDLVVFVTPQVVVRDER